MSRNEFLFIAGPCSVEDKTQIFETASFLKSLGINLLRGGAFKPRTNPDSFQGLGMKGIRMLREAADNNGMNLVSEIMSEEDIPAVSKMVDIIQIGSRNCQNFSLLRRAARTGKPILLKRGFGMTVEEFIQASRYIENEGNDRIILVERGIRTFESSVRFTLDISAVPILKERTRFPVVVDPSHPAGNRKYVEPLSLAAIGAGADGLMIEVHPDPDSAKSDALQQLNFQQFKNLYYKVVDVRRSLGLVSIPNR
ncbi:MAG: 3-deoxy-7-phosphoheptulonate synthase [Candidatus Thermoplasmatota archaeon]|nr:3-deoxy-7-phosphoheptulonate synthase [Candidatus Thermoplasmatota archaeon]